MAAENQHLTTSLRIGAIDLNMRSSILNLPIEVLSQICSYFPPNAPPPFGADLARICRVNKLFYKIATPMLYRDVHLNYTSIFHDTSKILRSFLDSDLEEEHPGIKFVRNLRILEGRPRPNELEDFERKKNHIREEIADFMSKIKPNQLSSLYVETTDFEEFYKESLGDQKNLKNLHIKFSYLNEGDLPSFPSEAWVQQIKPHLSLLKNSTASLSLSGLSITIGSITITKIDIKPQELSSSLRSIGLTTVPFLSSGQGNFETQFDQTIKNFEDLTAFLLSHTNGEGFNLEELNTSAPSPNRIEEYLTSISERLTSRVDQLRKLKLGYEGLHDRDGPIRTVTSPTLPLAKNLTDLRLYYTGGRTFLNDQIVALPCKLKVLYIVHSDYLEDYITPQALMPHSETLETLWLEISKLNGAGPGMIPLSVLENPNCLDWNFLISKQFPKLREVGAFLSPDSVEQGLVGENFQVVRILNDQYFHCDCRYEMKGFAEQAFTKLYARETSPKLKVIAFGTPNRPLSSRYEPEYEEVIIFFGRREKDMLGRDTASCTPVNARQARYLLPDITIIGEDERSLRSVEKWSRLEA